MIDLMDRFVMFLMDEFYTSLENDLKRWTENFAEAVEEGKTDRMESALKYIKDYSELMNDLRDENMDIKDFVGLIAEKYGVVIADAD